MFDAEWLMRQNFPPLEYVVDGVIPEGLSLLVAAPKIGKSWMVLGLALAASNGGYAFGHIQVARRPVLYLALEDGQRRLQSRLKELGASKPSPLLNFITRAPKGSILGVLGEFMAREHSAPPVVILDTLGKAMPPALGGESAYERDYRVAGALKGITDECPGSSVIVVHHTRKADGADFIDAVSGTQGLAGAADTILLLKRDRQNKDATLQVTSRDAAEGEYALHMEGAGSWELTGASLTEAARAAQTARTTDGVGDRMGELIAKVNQYPEGVTPKDLATMLHMEDSQVGMYLKRAHDSERIDRPKRGLYTPVTSVRSVTSTDGQTNTNNGSNTLRESA